MNFYITLSLVVVFGLAVWWLYLIVSGLRNAENNDINSDSSRSSAEIKKQALGSGRASKWVKFLLSSICFWRDQENR